MTDVEADILSEMEYVRDLISRLPEDDILGKYSLEGRLVSLEEELAEERRHPTRPSPRPIATRRDIETHILSEIWEARDLLAKAPENDVLAKLSLGGLIKSKEEELRLWREANKDRPFPVE